MIYAQKGNKLRQIAEADIDTYVAQGFKIVDERGAVLKETVPMDIPTLRNAYAHHVAEINALKAKVAELEAQLKVAKEKPVKAEKAKEPVEEVTEAEAEKKPTKGRKAQ